MDRYGLYGVIPKEREVNEPMTAEQQRIGDTGETLIYETDDTAEARAIYEAGGFERDGQWHVVTRVEDRTKGPRIELPTQNTLDKRSYDQS